MPNEPTIESVQAANREYARRIKDLESQVAELQRDKQQMQARLNETADALEPCIEMLRAPS